jgi:hypothetical protein
MSIDQQKALPALVASSQDRTVCFYYEQVQHIGLLSSLLDTLFDDWLAISPHAASNCVEHCVCYELTWGLRL